MFPSPSMAKKPWNISGDRSLAIDVMMPKKAKKCAKS